MIYVMLSGGRIQEIPEGVNASEEGDQVICRDLKGCVVATFSSQDVTAFGKHEAFRTMFLEQTTCTTTAEPVARRQVERDT